MKPTIISHGRWTAEPTPVPEFFYQPHVLVAPHLASKYFPGHALLLALGALLQLAPQVVPLALAALSGMLLFRLVSKSLNATAGVFAWLIWISTPLVLGQYQASYMSEVTSGSGYSSRLDFPMGVARIQVTQVDARACYSCRVGRADKTTYNAGLRRSDWRGGCRRCHS